MPICWLDGLSVGWLVRADCHNFLKPLFVLSEHLCSEVLYALGELTVIIGMYRQTDENVNKKWKLCVKRIFQFILTGINFPFRKFARMKFCTKILKGIDFNFDTNPTLYKNSPPQQIYRCVLLMLCPSICSLSVRDSLEHSLLYEFLF